LEQEADAAAGAEISAALAEAVAHVGHGARRIVGRGLDQDRHAVRRVTFVDDLLVVGDVFSGRTLDRRFDLVLRHVDRACVLYDAPKLRIAVRVRAAGLDGDDDFLADAREGFRHAVPAREHRVLSGLEDASHSGAETIAADVFSNTPPRGAGTSVACEAPAVLVCWL